MPKTPPAINLPTIRAPQLRLLEKLCTACSVSGDEDEVRKIVLENIKAGADELKIDPLGNVLATKKSQKISRKASPSLRVMIAAHMDEVGFMITSDEGDGFYRFQPVGGIDERQLAGKPVNVGKDHTIGVIGAKPVHLTTVSERKNTIPIDSLRIDLSPAGKKAAPGDRAVFATGFSQLGPSIRAKALDDRLGVATLIELFNNPPPNIELLAAFTVQEEVGLRGARVAAYTFDPDIAIVLDCTPAYDLPSSEATENTRYNTRLDHGPAIYIADSATLSDPRLIRHFTEIAELYAIPYQFRQAGGGGTDAGAIHKTRAGIPTLSISVPGRYLHTAAALARTKDWQSTLQLVYAALYQLNSDILSQER